MLCATIWWDQLHERSCFEVLASIITYQTCKHLCKWKHDLSFIVCSAWRIAVKSCEQRGVVKVCTSLLIYTTKLKQFPLKIEWFCHFCAKTVNACLVAFWPVIYLVVFVVFSFSFSKQIYPLVMGLVWSKNVPVSQMSGFFCFSFSFLTAKCVFQFQDVTKMWWLCFNIFHNS